VDAVRFSSTEPCILLKCRFFLSFSLWLDPKFPGKFFFANDWMPGFTTSEQKRKMKISNHHFNHFGQSNHQMESCGVHLTERKTILIQPIEETLFAFVWKFSLHLCCIAPWKKTFPQLNKFNLVLASCCHSITTYEKKHCVVFLILQTFIKLFKFCCS
jgi:hypothetical protein